jgi:hypothetical protein
LCRPPSTATSSTTTSRGEGGGVQLHAVCEAPLAREVAAVPPAVHTLTQLKDTSTTHFSLRPNSHSHPSPSFCPQQNRWQEHGTARKRVERLAGSDSPSSNLTLSPPPPRLRCRKHHKATCPTPHRTPLAIEMNISILLMLKTQAAQEGRAHRNKNNMPLRQ